MCVVESYVNTSHAWHWAPETMIIAFDLDGTISDPVVGITGAINYALDKLGYEQKSRKSLEKYIGPPLQDIFADILEDEDELVSFAIAFFRERYFDTGYRENIIYPGVEDLLASLKADRHTLYIATAKKTEIARSVADYFGITKYFKGILGCGLKRNKNELLQKIKEMENSESLLMIGDRRHDMKAGKDAECVCIGVLWGYGGREELLDSGADALCRSTDELKALIHAMPVRRPTS